jgi:hypothetical protein
VKPGISLPTTGPHPEYAEPSPYLRWHKVFETPFMNSKKRKVQNMVFSLAVQ